MKIHLAKRKIKKKNIEKIPYHGSWESEHFEHSNQSSLFSDNVTNDIIEKHYPKHRKNFKMRWCINWSEILLKL